MTRGAVKLLCRKPYDPAIRPSERGTPLPVEGGRRRTSRGEGRAIAWSLLLAAGGAMLLGSAGIASAQEIMPNDFFPAPDGTNVNLGYFVYGHQGSFVTPNGTNIPNSSANAFIGVERFARYQYLFGHPAGFLVAQAFGSFSNPTVGGTNLGTATGASNFNIAGFFWPYANFERKEYLVVGAYLSPPTGTYNKNQPINSPLCISPTANITGPATFRSAGSRASATTSPMTWPSTRASSAIPPGRSSRARASR